MDAGEQGSIRVRAAHWPQDLAVSQRLLEAYREFLLTNPAGPVAICLDGYARELETLQEKYEGKSATFLLAWAGDKPVGCAAVQRLPERDNSAEMKRLYVDPAGRGRGVGRALIAGCAAWARAQGAAELLLDTVPAAMPGAVKLYEELGFAPAERYHHGDLPGLAFFRLALE